MREYTDDRRELLECRRVMMRENAAIYGERKSDAGGGDETCATKALGEKADLDLYLPDL